MADSIELLPAHRIPPVIRGQWRLAVLLTVLLAGLLPIGVALAQLLRSTSLGAQLLHWSPLLLWGMLVNIQISALAIALGTVAGLFVGALQLSPLPLLRVPARWYVQLFRNAPMLVLIYFATYVFPFEIQIGRHFVSFPDWIKVTLGLALPASANVADEIFRGAIASIPSAQWEASASLGLRRQHAYRWVILPQCLRRMLPPWMNLYATITMGTSLASLAGVKDLLDSAQIASATVNRVDFTVAVYFFTLLLFFLYCYPISRLTQTLEKRHAYY
ncbi:MAG: Inner membrane amino-acid ABC transporter permease protein YhdY [Herbaspirillum frisingense]|uniref:Inner membrane amino-acid ABC transporter permease protein YhdY n=1 Tax=Herbaspirillum frisingense TaxID=92645 RepID=A0A7V8JTN2_9BURK|nr:MAG: Inner membrane amino-acid ABC transporter permease protein YhdY [Herbaspirillum frisingense]